MYATQKTARERHASSPNVGKVHQLSFEDFGERESPDRPAVHGKPFFVCCQVRKKLTSTLT